MVAVNDQRLQVRQDAAPCRFELVISRPHFDANPATGTVAVTVPDGCSWTASSNASWLTITSSGGTGNGSVAFRVAGNEGAERSGAIAIGGEVVAVSQGNAPVEECTASIQPTGASMPAADGSLTVAVTSTSGCAWTATSSVPWITITAGATGSGNGAVSLTVAANKGSARTGRLQIAGETFTLNQSGFDVCVAVISPTAQSIAATGATSVNATVSVAAACVWTAVSHDAWITVTSGPNGTGNRTVTFNVASNSGGARTGTLTIAGHTFTVTQAGACTYSISPTNATIASSGGTGSAAVSTSGGCNWTATANAGWITITSGASGTGNGTVAFSVAQLSGDTRSGSLTIAGNTFIVTQIRCSYALSPLDQSAGALGGVFTVSVSTTVGCAWSATTNTPWVSVTSGANGTGNGTVTFLVLPNVGGARTGTLTIAGQTFAVKQAALLSAKWRTSPDPITIRADWRFAHRDTAYRGPTNQQVSLE